MIGSRKRNQKFTRAPTEVRLGLIIQAWGDPERAGGLPSQAEPGTGTEPAPWFGVPLWPRRGLFLRERNDAIDPGRKLALCDGNAITFTIDAHPQRRTILASITIRRIDDGLKRQLRIRADEHGHSMEEEARRILCTALTGQPTPPANLAQAIRARFAPLGGVELDIPPRQPMPEPPQFD